MITLTFSVEQAQTLINGLAELPAKQSFELIAAIKSAGDAYLDAQAKASPESPTEEVTQDGQE